MAKQIIMDHTGDRQHYFDRDDALALMKAEKRFMELTRLGIPPPYGRSRGTSRESNRSIRQRRKRCSFPGWSEAEQP
jgi:hypothetical protein